jgi:putative hemolysin
LGTYGAQLLLVLLLILVNGALSGSEMALISLREGQVRRLEAKSKGGRVLARLLRDPNRFLGTIQIGITLAGFLASAFAATALAKPLIGPLSFLGAAADPVAVIVLTLVLTFVTLVLGELAPKRIALQHAEAWATSAARPLDWLATATRPVVWLLGKSTDLAVRLTGSDPGATREDTSPEEIRELVLTQTAFSAQQREIISGAFDISARTVRAILVPRRDVTSLPASMPADLALRTLAKSGHFRAPVVGPSGLDDVVGLVNLRDLLDADGIAADHIRPAVFLPETLSVAEAMRQLRHQREQFALVVDERGDIDGIVTMEDLVEEVIGEIYDETDRDVVDTVREPSGDVLMPGTFPIHDLPDLGIEIAPLPDSGYTTVAGLILHALGHIPTAPGEIATLPGFTAEVVEVTGRAITRVRLRVTTGRTVGAERSR